MSKSSESVPETPAQDSSNPTLGKENTTDIVVARSLELVEEESFISAESPPPYLIAEEIDASSETQAKLSQEITSVISEGAEIPPKKIKSHPKPSVAPSKAFISSEKLLMQENVTAEGTKPYVKFSNIITVNSEGPQGTETLKKHSQDIEPAASIYGETTVISLRSEGIEIRKKTSPEKLKPNDESTASHESEIQQKVLAENDGTIPEPPSVAVVTTEQLPEGSELEQRTSESEIIPHAKSSDAPVMYDVVLQKLSFGESGKQYKIAEDDAESLTKPSRLPEVIPALPASTEISLDEIHPAATSVQVTAPECALPISTEEIQSFVQELFPAKKPNQVVKDEISDTCEEMARISKSITNNTDHLINVLKIIGSESQKLPGKITTTPEELKELTKKIPDVLRSMEDSAVALRYAPLIFNAKKNIAANTCKELKLVCGRILNDCQEYLTEIEIPSDPAEAAAFLDLTNDLKKSIEGMSHVMDDFLIKVKRLEEMTVEMGDLSSLRLEDLAGPNIGKSPPEVPLQTVESPPKVVLKTDEPPLPKRSSRNMPLVVAILFAALSSAVLVGLIIIQKNRG